jgi:hypothetical protein
MPFLSSRTARLALLLALPLSAAAPSTAQIWQLDHAGSATGDHFGSAVSIDDGTIVVGASGTDECGLDSGAAFVYERGESDRFELVARLQPSVCERGRFFGRAVAAGADLAAVAAGGEALGFTSPNAVHVFARSAGDDWYEETVLEPPRGRQMSAGFASSIAASGERIVVAEAGGTGARRAHGAVHIYERVDGHWTLAATLRPERDLGHGIFGSDVAVDGDLIAVTASPYAERGQGSIYVFERDAAGHWRKQAHLSGFEGQIVRADLSGRLLVVGASGTGPDGSGAAIVFIRRPDGEWTRVGTLRSTVPYRGGAFGTLVAADGSASAPRILVVGYTEQLGRGVNIDRVVHVFGYDTENGWVQRQVIDLGDWAFGMAVGLSGRTAVIGRTSDDMAGAVYVVRLFE